MPPKALRVPAVEVRVQLRDIDPPIWRRLVLPGHWNLGAAHLALQLAFGWYNEHLHVFEVGERRFGPPDPDGSNETESETLVRVHEILQQPGDTFTYRYDFGDNWLHDVVVDKILGPQKEACCLDGRRAGPPENSGGPGEYEYKLSVLAEAQTDAEEDDDEGDEDLYELDYDERAGIVEWLGADFDPELVDIAWIDAALRRLS